jgi:hypothetical protein
MLYGDKFPTGYGKSAQQQGQKAAQISPQDEVTEITINQHGLFIRNLD